MTAQPRRPVRSARVRKADEPLPVAVYNQNGKLVGIVMDPDKIQPLANSETEPDLTPAPAAEVGTPADTVADGVAKLRKTVYAGRTPEEQAQAAEALNAAAIVGLDIIHGRRRPPRSAA